MSFLIWQLWRNTADRRVKGGNSRKCLNTGSAFRCFDCATQERKKEKIMRIAFKEGTKIKIRGGVEVRIGKSGNLVVTICGIHGLTMKTYEFFTGEKSEDLFRQVLTDGYLDLSGFESRRVKYDDA